MTKPIKGILTSSDHGDMMMYYVQCDCHNDDHAHNVVVEADCAGVEVTIYAKTKSKWWQLNRFKQIWQLLTKGYLEMETTLILDEDKANNYGKTLIAASKDVKIFRELALHEEKKYVLKS